MKPLSLATETRRPRKRDQLLISEAIAFAPRNEQAGNFFRGRSSGHWKSFDFFRWILSLVAH